MNECEKCQGRKFLRSEDGTINPCSCVLKDQVSRYFSPLKRFITHNAVNVTPIKLENKSQAIVMTDQNMVSLIGLIRRAWFPEEYSIITLEEINEIGFDRHPKFKSIYSYINHSTNHILDCGFLSKIRTRNEGFKEKDSLYVIELVKHILANEEGTIIIILPSNFQTFVKEYRELCECLVDLGIQCFRNGKYQPLLNKEGNDECSING